LAPRARIDTSGRATPDRGGVDQPVRIVSQPRPGSRGARGTVAVQYVVTGEGRVDPASVTVLLATAPRLEAAAREAVLASRFEAARKGGLPVRQLVQQVITWR